MSTFKRSIKKEDAAPSWAVQFLQHVGADYGRDDIPVLRWQSHSTQHWSSRGAYNYMYTPGSNRSSIDDHYITVTPGSDILDQIQVVLHEAAHWIAGHSEGHSMKYWNIYFDMVKEYELPLSYCFYRSARYKSTAVYVAKQRYRIPRTWDMQLMLFDDDDATFRPEPFYTNWNPTNYPWRVIARIKAPATTQSYVTGAAASKLAD